MRKKKERVILFTENEMVNSDTADATPDTVVSLDVVPGKFYRIGKPSNRYYEYIHPVLEPGGMSVRELEGFRKIQDTVVKAIGILSMTNGDRIVTLWKYDEDLYKDTTEKIYAYIDKSISSGELISLDLETERKLALKNFNDVD